MFYEYKGNKYNIIEEGEMKCWKRKSFWRMVRVWVPCIIYRSSANAKIYVRERDEFYQRFKEVDDAWRPAAVKKLVYNGNHGR